jgi:hypothetical protein
MKNILNDLSIDDKTLTELKDVLLFSAREDRQEYGVISADRMTPEIANALAFLDCNYSAAFAAVYPAAKIDVVMEAGVSKVAIGMGGVAGGLPRRGGSGGRKTGARGRLPPPE